jgi:oxygen-independent coproporphyrinogen-3 oxidase
MPKSCYIHIPFCSGGKCKYCSFVSFNKSELITGYIYSLLKEISDNYSGETLKTIYLGGGTPSLVSAELLKKVIGKFNLADDAEVTTELNPENGNYDYLKKLREIGFNRLSIGSQTFDDELLKLSGRRHDSEDIIKTVENAKNAGFNNISLDLIYGLPTQTTEGIIKDLDKFLELGIQHISTYGLKIEKETFWGKNPPENIPDEDIQADMYECINERLTNAGFYRYEISNFAKPGFESKHNLNYWNNEEYYGFGVSAHGYCGGVRYSNYCTLEKYMNNPSSHEYGKFLTEQEKLEEEIFLGFRKTEGININRIKEKFGIDFEKKYRSVIEKYSDYIIKTQDGFAFNLKGSMLSNEILPEFLD